MKYLILALSVLSSGCAGRLAWVGDMYDKNDICQSREFASSGARLKPANYQQPTGCGGTRVTTGVIRNSQGHEIGVITNR